MPLSRGIPPLSSVVRRHLSTILAAVVVFVGFAGFYVASVQSTYTSTALILLSPVPGNPLSPDNASGSGSQFAVAMDTEARLLLSAPVSRAVSEDLGRTVPDVNETVEVSVPSNTQMVEIAYTARSPERAQSGAQGFAEGYLAYRSERASSGQETRVETLRQEVEDTKQDLRRATTEASAEKGQSFASQEVPLLAARLAQLGEDLSAAEAVSTNPGSVINPAPEVTEANQLPPWIFFAAAAVLGALSGVAIALVREWRRDLVRNMESNELEVPAWSTVVAQGAAEGLLATHGTAEYEAYRRLRVAVVANAPRPQVLGVTSIKQSVSTAIAANLAVVLAEAEFSVLLIAPGLQGSSAEDFLGHAPRRGLVDAVGGQADPRASLETTHGVSVLVGGQGLEDAPELLSSPWFRAMIDDLRADFDYVLTDAGVTGAADSDAILLAADSAVIAIPTDTTTRAQLQSTLVRFDQLGIHAVGAVRVDSGGRGRRGGATGVHAGTAGADVRGRVEEPTGAGASSEQGAGSRAHVR